jgi:hypothetical protein
MSPVVVLSLVDLRGIEPRRFVPLDEPEWGGRRSSRSWAKHQARPVECASTLVVPPAHARRGTEGSMMDLVQMRAANWPVRSHGCE